MKKTISIILIVTGIMFFIMPLTMNQIVKYQIHTIVDENILKEPINQEEKIEGEFDYLAVTDVSILSLIEATRNIDKGLIIGTISIPDLDIYLPIMKGLTNSNLIVGAATMKPDQSFGVGNYTLSGHNMKNKDLLFGRLMDIQVGSMVYISDGENNYQYKIYETMVVLDDAMDMLSDEKSEEKGKPIVSLMTCSSSSETEKRFFALGELVELFGVSP